MNYIFLRNFFPGAKRLAVLAGFALLVCLASAASHASADAPSSAIPLNHAQLAALLKTPVLLALNGDGAPCNPLNGTAACAQFNTANYTFTCVSTSGIPTIGSCFGSPIGGGGGGNPPTYYCTPSMSATGGTCVTDPTGIIPTSGGCGPGVTDCTFTFTGGYYCDALSNTCQFSPLNMGNRDGCNAALSGQGCPQLGGGPYSYCNSSGVCALNPDVTATGNLNNCSTANTGEKCVSGAGGICLGNVCLPGSGPGTTCTIGDPRGCIGVAPPQCDYTNNTCSTTATSGVPCPNNNFLQDCARTGTGTCNYSNGIPTCDPNGKGSISCNTQRSGADCPEHPGCANDAQGNTVCQWLPGVTPPGDPGCNLLFPNLSCQPTTSHVTCNIQTRKCVNNPNAQQSDAACQNPDGSDKAADDPCTGHIACQNQTCGFVTTAGQNDPTCYTANGIYKGDGSQCGPVIGNQHVVCQNNVCAMVNNVAGQPNTNDPQCVDAQGTPIPGFQCQPIGGGGAHCSQANGGGVCSIDMAFANNPPCPPGVAVGGNCQQIIGGLTGCNAIGQCVQGGTFGNCDPAKPNNANGVSPDCQGIGQNSPVTCQNNTCAVNLNPAAVTDPQCVVNGIPTVGILCSIPTGGPHCDGMICSLVASTGTPCSNPGLDPACFPPVSHCKAGKCDPTATANDGIACTSDNVCPKVSPTTFCDYSGEAPDCNTTGTSGIACTSSAACINPTAHCDYSGQVPRCSSTGPTGNAVCASDPECITHQVCNNSNQCVAVQGQGVDQCASDAECQAPPLTCDTASKKCRLAVIPELPDAGCITTGADCGDHCDLATNQCTSTGTGGSCASNSDCTGVTHLECDASSQCKRVQGPGSDTCSTNANCIGVTHLACNTKNQCAPVAGGGADTCASNADCAASTSPGGKIHGHVPF